MKTSLFFVFVLISLIGLSSDKSFSKNENESSKALSSAPKSNEYGIYGEVVWPVSGIPENAVESPVVIIEKMVSGSWVYHGTTYASACGYYTYDTGGTGKFRAVIGGYYYLRSYPGCATRVDYDWNSGSGEGIVTYWTPWKVINVRCS